MSRIDRRGKQWCATAGAASVALALALPAAATAATSRHASASAVKPQAHGAAKAGKSGGQQPPGNNGHIQIDELSADGGAGNDAHVSCAFSINFFGYDAGTQHAAITVRPAAPTRGKGSAELSASWVTSVRTGGNQLDANVPVTAAELATAFAGVTPAKQGYHARVEVSVTGSIGASTKTHMVWITPCAQQPAAVVARVAASQNGSLSVVERERVNGSGSYVRGPVRARVGDTVDYRIVVTNTGAISLAAALSARGCDSGTLAPMGTESLAAGASATYTCSRLVTAVPSGHLLRNVAVASATTATGTVVGNSHSTVLAHIVVATPKVRSLPRAKPATAAVELASFTG